MFYYSAKITRCEMDTSCSQHSQYQKKGGATRGKNMKMVGDWTIEITNVFSELVHVVS